MLRNQAGEARLVMNPGCKDFEKVHWKADPHGDAVADIDRSDPRRSHLSDALGYMIEKESQCRRARDGNQGLCSSALQIATIVAALCATASASETTSIVMGSFANS